MSRRLRNHLAYQESEISRARIIPRLPPLVVIADSEWLLLCFPGIENHAASAIFAELSDLFLLEDAEGFAGVVFAVNIGWVEDVAQLLLVETVEFRVPRVKLGAEYRPPLRVEHERLALISQRLRPAFQRVGGVGKLKDSRHNEINIVL